MEVVAEVAERRWNFFLSVWNWLFGREHSDVEPRRPWLSCASTVGGSLLTFALVFVAMPKISGSTGFHSFLDVMKDDYWLATVPAYFVVCGAVLCCTSRKGDYWWHLVQGFVGPWLLLIPLLILLVLVSGLARLVIWTVSLILS